MKPVRLALLIATLFATPLAPSAFAAIPGLDAEGMDPSIRPQDDLSGAMNGRWFANTTIPADKASYGSFHKLDDLSNARVKTIVEELAAKKQLAGNELKIASFYRSFMDTQTIDKRGLAPAKEWFDKIDAIRGDAALARTLGELQGVAKTPVYLSAGADDKDTTTNVPQTWQSGLGMPDRDYYLKDTPKFVAAREAYVAYLTALLKFSGSKAPAREAKEVYELERKLAEVHWDKVDNRDPIKTYNAMNLAQLKEKAPGFDWPAFFAGAGLTWSNKIIVSQPSMVEGFAALTGEFPVETWRAYLRVRLLDSLADFLPQTVRDESFKFRGKTLTGAEVQKPRWELATKAVSEALGEAVGQVYVAKHFPPEYKARMQVLVGNLMQAFKASIDSAPWMSAETKTKAQAKLAAYNTKIGYPEKWRDYSKLVIKEGDAFGNAVRGGRFEHERKIVRAGQKVDRSEWGMPPQQVNAYYSPNFNEIVFPAAILESPFFNMAADDAINYGGIGAVIGHEIGHGFDDQGSQFDGNGNLNNWWTEADRKAFNALGDRLVAQYESYEPLPGHKINGRVSLGENIADNSGLQIAFKAYKLSLGGKPAPVIDGKTGEQRFFLSYAQIWRTKMREEVLLRYLTTGPHSPGQFRANGAAVNDDGFHAAFGTQPGDKMYKAPEDRVRIW